LPSAADIIITTPLLEDAPIGVTEALAPTHAVVVISPDVTSDGTPGQTVASIERRLRIGRLRAAGATVINWETTRSLSTALEAKQ
jgi:hypothetical protein